MRKLFQITAYVLGGLLALLLLTGLFFQIKWSLRASADRKLLGEAAPVLTENGFSFRDLNKNGKLDVYEDARAPIPARVEDLLAQMTLEEKAGAMFITMAVMKKDGGTVNQPVLSADPLLTGMSLAMRSNLEMVARLHMNHFNTLQPLEAEAMARWNNAIQEMAERTRLGIPVTIATDPRHGPGENPGAAIFTPSFSHWPTPLGLAAARDTALVREFGDIARQEYRAVGITLALHPMADLATEPRWARINGTFGEDAQLAAQMTKAYVLGFQGDTLGPQSVACMTKHFAGGGPQKDGEDPHFPYGKEQVYPGNNFDYHLIPFEQGAFPARTAQIMPYYGIPVGQTSEDVGFAFNKDIITGLLRGKYGFDGVVCTDWNIISDSFMGEGRKWGVENLPPIQRVKKVIDAGCDMFGGEAIPEMVVELVKTGQLTEARIDESVRRILRDKFRLGLFDDPYVDVDRVGAIVSRPDFVAKGKDAQRRSIVLLKNQDALLPLPAGVKIFVDGFDRDVARRYAEVVDDPLLADVIIKRLTTPYDKRDDSFIESFFHAGRLYFTEEERNDILGLINQKPSVVGINLERPAILPQIAAATQAMLADFGVEDDAFFDVLFGKFSPTGKLPFELPSSAEAVMKQLEDVPYDSESPVFPFGFGLTY